MEMKREYNKRYSQNRTDELREKRKEYNKRISQNRWDELREKRKERKGGEKREKKRIL